MYLPFITKLRSYAFIIVGLCMPWAVQASGPSNNTVGSIAPIEQALTLAQVKKDGAYHTLLVLEETDGPIGSGEITVLDLSVLYDLYPKDPLDLVTSVGEDRIRGDLRMSQKYVEKQARLDLVITPGIGLAHVAAGTNYRAHGDEVEMDEVFLFPKFSKATSHMATLAAKPESLMDYEIELCARFDRDVSTMKEFDQALKGVFLCGDYTDRATLLRNIDTDNVASGRGFTDAKSGDNRFPIGPYTVVPKDWNAVLYAIEMKLWVNGELRQNASGGAMIDKLDDIVFNSLSQGDELRWSKEGTRIRLIDHGTIRKGQVVLTGTPEGVVFRKPSTGFKVLKGAQWFFGFGFLSSGPVDYVLEEYIENELEDEKYLQPGDEVRMQASYLGEIQMKVVH